MQRAAIRGTFDGVEKDVPIGVFTDGQLAQYDAASNSLKGVAAGPSGDFIGPGASVDNHLVLFSGLSGKLGKDSAPVVVAASGNITGLGTLNTRTIANWVDGPGGAVAGNLPSFNGAGGKLIQDSGVAAALIGAHASRHLPAGADSLFTGSWGAFDVPVWTGAAFVPKRQQSVQKTGDQTVATTVPVNCNGLLFTSLKAGSAYTFRFVLFYLAAATTTGLRVTVSYNGVVSQMKYGATIPRTAQAADWQATNVNGGQLTVTDSTITRNIATIEGSILTTGVGDLQLQIAGDAAANLTVELNSFGTIQEI